MQSWRPQPLETRKQALMQSQVQQQQQTHPRVMTIVALAAAAEVAADHTSEGAQGIQPAETSFETAQDEGSAQPVLEVAGSPEGDSASSSHQSGCHSRGCESHCSCIPRSSRTLMVGQLAHQRVLTGPGRLLMMRI